MSQITARLSDTAGQPIEGAVVRAELDKVEFDAGTIVPEAVEATTDANGEAVLALVPNNNGTRGSKYRITARSSAGDLLLDGEAVVSGDAFLSDILTDVRSRMS